MSNRQVRSALSRASFDALRAWHGLKGEEKTQYTFEEVQHDQFDIVAEHVIMGYKEGRDSFQQLYVSEVYISIW